MYWHPSIHSLLDVRLLVRSSRSTINKRRSERNERISDESFWKDPPGCFDNIVWPAYVDSHSKLFHEGDVENGGIEDDIGIDLLEADQIDMTEMVDRACASIWARGSCPSM
jgi:nicotinamide/nicotinate riboside kinase